MAVGYQNDSYDRCMTELRARYTGRGVSVNAKKSAAEQEALEIGRLGSGESTMHYDRVSGIADCYRSGVYNGTKYMTSDDFIRYFRNRNSYSTPDSLVAARQKAMEAKAQQRSGALSVRRGGTSGATPIPADGAKEGHLASRVEALIKHWFPVEAKEGRTEGKRFRFPVAAAGSMAAFALSLGLIVTGSVMIGSASGELGTLNSEIAQLEAQQIELQSQLDMKYNIQDIESDAKNLGMIHREFAEDRYLEVGDDESIEIYPKEEKKLGLATLLNAFGIHLD